MTENKLPTLLLVDDLPTDKDKKKLERIPGISIADDPKSAIEKLKGKKYDALLIHLRFHNALRIAQETRRLHKNALIITFSSAFPYSTVIKGLNDMRFPFDAYYVMDLPYSKEGIDGRIKDLQEEVGSDLKVENIR